MEINYNGKRMTVGGDGVINGDPSHTFMDGVVYFHGRPEGEAVRVYSDKTYSIPYGAGATAFFAESEPNEDGRVRGTIATDFVEDEKGERVIACEPATIQASELTDEIEGVRWPSEVTA